MSKLYRITFISQTTGSHLKHYVLSESLDAIEQEYSDIVKIEPLTPLEDLTLSTGEQHER